MREAYYGAANDFRGYLKHHGIKGQKWGVKNGPPYPLELHNYKKKNKELQQKHKDLKRKEDEIEKKYYSDETVKSALKEMNEKYEELWKKSNRDWKKYSDDVDAYRKSYALKNKKFAKLTKQHDKELNDVLELQSNNYDEMDKLNHEVNAYLSTEIKRHNSYKELQSNKQKLRDLHEQMMGEDSPAFKNAYKNYESKYGADDYGFDHYEWLPGHKDYDAAYKEYQNKSAGYQKQIEEATAQIGKDVLQDLFNDKEIYKLYEFAIW